MKTYSARAADIDRKWHVVDAEGQALGRLASQVAQILKGKLKPQYTPHMDVGDFVIVVNAASVRLTGRKLTQKLYYRHSQFPGGLKVQRLDKLLAVRPSRVIEHAVRGMLPHNRLGEAMIKKLKVYSGGTHPHEAQVRGQMKQDKQTVQVTAQVVAVQATTPREEA
ncbi:MAG: 50S ribosomal protein L13 [Dehalococcoidia bacterium]|nr:50S ribosomal protein L13 [Dehalococcoidia bacterium]